MKKIIFSLLCLCLAAGAQAFEYSFTDCEGSLTPYPAPESFTEYPDSLAPVFINHVGRHGARYPASGANCLALQRALEKADSLGTITGKGRELMALNAEVIAQSTGRWGALDSLGMAEQAGIAQRMFYNFTEVFSAKGTIKAISSYSPRSMMSMYSFVHRLDVLNNRNTYITNTGQDNSALMRPFDIDKDYLDFRRSNAWKKPYDEYFEAVCPMEPIVRVLGDNYPFTSEGEQRDLAITEYYVLAGLSAMSMPNALPDFYTAGEANALWSCFNLRQYLQRTATTISTVPSDIASDLVMNLIETTDAYVNGTDTGTKAILRFGHAETLMPLLSLLRIPGCFYLTNYFDTVADHWHDFFVVPMAANIQFIVFQAKGSGNYYVRIELNEHPVALRHGDESIYYPWPELRKYMMSLISLV